MSGQASTALRRTRCDARRSSQRSDEAAIDETEDAGSETSPKIIYVPFQDFSNAFENSDTDVVLPYSEYKKLFDLWKERLKNDR